MDKPVVALFDFDGTLTCSDTLPLYIRHATGWGGLALSMLSTLPAMIVLACAGWKSVWGIDAGSTKERLLRRCFAGRTINEVATICHNFIPKVDAVLAIPVVERMRWHKAQGHKVVVVSASVDVWVRPWCDAQGVDEVIATRLQLDGDRYTGRFDGENCNGREKVNRIASHYSPADYHIVAYGNSSGDYPMFHYAHEAYLCTEGAIAPFHKS